MTAVASDRPNSLLYGKFLIVLMLLQMDNKKLKIRLESCQQNEMKSNRMAVSVMRQLLFYLSI